MAKSETALKSDNGHVKMEKEPLTMHIDNLLLMFLCYYLIIKLSLLIGDICLCLDQVLTSEV